MPAFLFLLMLEILCTQECVALEELYLSHNGISKMEGLSALVNLRVLDVSNNKLTSVDDIQNLTKYFTFPLLQTDFCLLVICFLHPDFNLTYRLEDLWLNDNQIESLEAITEAVTGSKEKLTTIYLENNPCVSLIIIFSHFSSKSCHSVS